MESNNIDILLTDPVGKKMILRFPRTAAWDIPGLAEVLDREISKYGPREMLMKAGREEDDLASFLSAKLDCPVMAGCVRIYNHAETGKRIVLCPDWEGDRYIYYELPDILTIITVKDGAAGDIPTRDLSFTGSEESEEGAVENPGRISCEIRHIEVKRQNAHWGVSIGIKSDSDSDGKKGSRKRLEEADCIVAGGRGFGSLEKFQTIIRFAEAIRADYATSRPNVDAGWIGKEHQVGLSGKTVAPSSYIACGISGAAHHTIGMSSSEWIMAINIDRNEPIFDIADVGVIGDAGTILERVMEKLSEDR